MDQFLYTNIFPVTEASSGAQHIASAEVPWRFSTLGSSRTIELPSLKCRSSLNPALSLDSAHSIASYIPLLRTHYFSSW
ncbi:unnamed protein product [Protopolystoma xenopodis]|uniref:Uncharacterized protein n=1 Tax=Protopolystoma xenopodis TaxID=117903 RepID=A0A448XHN7_9PLAT|nr:unnamed protein product [Protopolystoma xenopodis]